MHINQSEEKSNKKAPPAKDIVDLNSRRVHQSQLFPDDSTLNKFCHPSAEERNSTSRPQQSNTGGEGHVRPVLIPGTKLTIPLALDWSFDPAVDENPALSFEAGSRRDEDWQENDNMLKEGCGSENSYGISLILPDETIKKLPPSQLSSSILKIDNIIQMGHEVIIPFHHLLNIAESLMTHKILFSLPHLGHPAPSHKRAPYQRKPSLGKVLFEQRSPRLSAITVLGR